MTKDTDQKTGLGKVCTKCGEWKLIDEYHRHVDGVLGRQSWCKLCTNINGLKRRSRPEEKARQAAYDKKVKKLPHVAARNNELRRTPGRREKIRAWRKNRLNTDSNYALIERARGMIHRTLRAFGTSKNLPTFEILGYGPDKLRERIEFQFKKGMSWQNRDEWHIDHKKPLTAFLAQGKRDAKLINSLCNLQPLWGSENMSKNNKWPYAANDNQPLRKAEVA